VDFDLIIYRIKKEIFYSNNYLSKIIENKYKNVIDFDKNIFIKNWIWVSYFSSIIILLAIFIISDLKGFSLILDFLKNLITIPLLLVGIVIPVIVLMINVIEKRIYSGFLNVYYKRVNPLRVLKLSILSLVVCIVLYFFGTMHFSIDLSKLLPISPTPLYAAVIIPSIILPLALTFLAVTQIVTSVFDDKILYDQILDDFYDKIRLTIHNLVAEDCFKKLVKNYDNKLITIDDLFVGGSDEYRPYDSKKTGKIIDVDMTEISKLSDFLKTNEIELIIATLPGRSTFPYFKTVAYSKFIEETGNIDTFLNKSFVISQDYQDFRGDFKILFEATTSALNENDKLRYQRLLDIYFNCLEFYLIYLHKTHLDKPKYDDYFAMPLIREIFYDMDKFIANKKNPMKMLENLKYQFRNLAYKTVEFNDAFVLKLTLDRFISLYSCTVKSKDPLNPLEPIESIITSIQFNLEVWPIKKEVFYSQYSLLMDVLDSLEMLFRKSVDLEDSRTSKMICNAFANIFSNYSPKLNVILNREIQLKTELNELNSDNEKSKEISSELGLIDDIWDIGTNLEKVILSHSFEMSAYLLKKKVFDNDSKVYQKCFIILFEQVTNFDNLLTYTENIRFLDWNYERILYFCLSSLKFLDNINDVRPINWGDDHLEAIKKILDEIKEDHDKWKWFIDGNITEKADKFYKMCEKSFLAFKKREEQNIMKAELDTEKVKLFKDDLEELIDNSFRLGEKIDVTPDKSGTTKFKTDLTIREYKQFFLQNNQPPLNAKGLVHQYRKNKNFKDNQIINELITNINCASIDINELDSELASNIENMLQSDYSVDLIICSPQLEYAFYEMEEFKEDYRNNNINGYYHAIPVIVSLGRILNNEILLLDVAKSCELTQIHDLKIDVREPTENDRELIMKNDLKITEKELDLSVIIEISEEYAFDILDEGAITRLCTNNSLIQ
jgi:hypothetical protein